MPGWDLHAVLPVYGSVISMCPSGNWTQAPADTLGGIVRLFLRAYWEVRFLVASAGWRRVVLL